MKPRSRTVAHRAPPAGPRPLVAVYECSCHAEDLEAELAGSALEALAIQDGLELVEAVATRHPAALVYALRPCSESDLAVLKLVRLVSHDLPIVLVGDGDLETSRPVLDAVRPTVRLHLPLAPGVLATATQQAIASHAQPARAGA